MANQRFTEDLIHHHCVLSKRACRQERMLNWMAKRLYASAGCPFPAWEKCPEGSGFPCWKCWMREAERSADAKDGDYEKS